MGNTDKWLASYRTLMIDSQPESKDKENSHENESEKTRREGDVRPVLNTTVGAGDKHRILSKHLHKTYL